MSHLRTILLVLPAIALLLAGCSGEFEGNINTGDEIEGDDVVEAVLPEVEDQSGVTGLAMECPTAVKMAEGDEFDCEVLEDGEQVGIVHVTQTSDDGDVDWEFASIMDPAVVEDEIRRVGGEIGQPPTDVDCPEGIELGMGNDFECEVDGQLLEVMQTDDDGGLQFGELRPAG